ncbi:MAG TPA: hypothetical protein VF297_19850 [Pyrinomonadaceae bacterium]
MKKALPLLLFALLLHATAAGQTPAGEKAAEAEAELGRKALVLVEEALAEAQSLKLSENRVRAQATAARLLWPRDPKAARAAFKSAADGIAEMNAAVDVDDPQLYMAAQAVAQLRYEMVGAAAPYDASLALDFLRATRPTYTEALSAAGYGMPWNEQSLEMSVVSHVAAQDPRRAFEIAEESLSKGVSMSLVNVAQQLRSKEPALAAKLAAEIVRQLRSEDLRGQGEAGAVAQQLLALTTPAEGVPTNTVANSTGPAPLLDEQTRRELVEKILAAMAAGVPNNGGGYSLFYAFQTILPELEKSAPTRAAALRRRAEEIERGFNPQMQQIRPYQGLMEKGTTEAVLEAARTAPTEVRDQLYTHAAWKVFNEGGDVERARQILDNISNPQQRAQARRDLEQRTQWRAIQSGNFNEARQAAMRLKTPDERVHALLQVAARAVNANEAETARQVLEETRGLVESQTRGQQQFSFRLQVATAFARFDSAASFDVVESAVGRLNELLDAAEVLDGFGQDAFKDGELRAQGYVWTEMIGQCALTLGQLARADFERAAAAAKRFRRPEVRVNVRLFIAQHALSGVPQQNRRMRSAPVPLVIYEREGLEELR